MPTLREVRGRINGVKKTQKITRAMKMVAAAKLRRAQTAVIAARPYATTMHGLLRHLASVVGPEADPLFLARPVDRVTLVAITADRGLCGAFNSNIIKTTQARMQTEYASFVERNKLRLVCVGKKGSDYFRKQRIPVEQTFPGVFHRLEFSTARAVVRLLLGMYQRGETDLIEVISNEFKNVAQQRIVVEQFLPILPEVSPAGMKERPAEYIYEPGGAAILRSLLPRYLDFRIWRALLETNAAQEGARMTAMDNATENADEMISTLQLQYNKARQASITKELLEIVGGAEALARG
jgi:F-type H+-transporting ATPase subunit gamma